MLDADPAGRAATMKVVHLFVEAELPCRIAQLRAQGGKKQDPDELARKDLPKLQALIDEAQDAVEFYFEQVASTSAPTVPGRVAAIEEVAPLVAHAPRSAGARSVLRQAGDAARGRHGPGAAGAAGDAGAPAEAARRAAARRPAGAGARDRAATDFADALLAPGVPRAALRVLAPRRGLLFEGRRRARVGCLGATERQTSTRPGCSTPAPPRFATPWPRRSAPTSLPATRTRTARFESIVTAMRLPSDLASLMQERSAAIERGDLELTEKLNARINAVRRSSR